jgi:hypothetical protein
MVYLQGHAHKEQARAESNRPWVGASGRPIVWEYEPASRLAINGLFAAYSTRCKPAEPLCDADSRLPKDR